MARVESRDLPPGVHLQANAGWLDGLVIKWTSVRLLGDESRGYLMVGLPRLPGGDDYEFWFTTIDEAFAFARGLGVRDEDWVEILSVSEVRAGPPHASP
jgi:hypothetical protein